MLKVKNFVPVISVEGFEEADGLPSGQWHISTRAVNAMTLLKQQSSAFRHLHLLHQRQYQRRQHRGLCGSSWWMGRLFCLVLPLHACGQGCGAGTAPIAGTERIYVSPDSGAPGKKPIFMLDFQNDGEYVGGCIAGGRRYLHINANGDVRSLRVHSLFRFQHPGKELCWSALCSPHVHGIPRWSTVQ